MYIERSTSHRGLRDLQEIAADPRPRRPRRRRSRKAAGSARGPGRPPLKEIDHETAHQTRPGVRLPHARHDRAGRRLLFHVQAHRREHRRGEPGEPAGRQVRHERRTFGPRDHPRGEKLPALQEQRHPGAGQGQARPGGLEPGRNRPAGCGDPEQRARRALGRGAPGRRRLRQALRPGRGRAEAQPGRGDAAGREGRPGRQGGRGAAERQEDRVPAGQQRAGGAEQHQRLVARHAPEREGLHARPRADGAQCDRARHPEPAQRLRRAGQAQPGRGREEADRQRAPGDRRVRQGAAGLGGRGPAGCPERGAGRLRQDHEPLRRHRQPDGRRLHPHQAGPVREDQRGHVPGRGGVQGRPQRPDQREELHHPPG